MPKYKVQTDQGNFQVELDRAPDSPDQLNEIIQLHLSGKAANERIAADKQELNRLETAEPIPEVTPQKTIGRSIMSGITGIPGGIASAAKTIGKAAITQPEEGFFTPVSPSTSFERLKDVARGAASGLSLGMYQPEVSRETEAAKARQVGGMVAGSVAPFTGLVRGGQALGLGRAGSQAAAGGVIGAARPLSQGDIYGAIEGATAGGATALLPEALTAPAKAVRAVRGAKAPTAAELEAATRLKTLQTELGSLERPAAEAQTTAAKAAAEAKAKGIALEAETAKAQRSLADEARMLRQSERALETEKAALKAPNEEAVGRVANSLLSKPVSKQEAGQFFQGKYKELKKAASEEGGAKYDEVANIAGDTMFERPGLGQAMNQLMEESGTLKNFLSSAPQRAAKEVKGHAMVESPIRGRVREQQSSIALEEGFFEKYKNYFPPKKPGEPDIMPLELWRDLTSGKLMNPRATVGDMIIDRQKIRAAARAAGSAGRLNEARQLGMLDDGITADIKRSSPNVTKAIDAADAFWRDEYIPRFGFKTLPTKGAGRSSEDVVNFFFRKETTKSADAAAEALQNTIKNPADMARLSRAWIDNIVQKSVDKKTGQFSNDSFLKEYLSYPDRVREIAAGGTKAKQQLDEIAKLMQRGNVGEEVIGELGKTVKEGERAVREGARTVSRLAGETPDMELQIAARDVSRLGKQQKTAEKKVITEREGQAAEIEAAAARPSDIMRRAGNYAMGSGMLTVGYGTVSGNPAAAIGGAVTVGAGALTRLLASPKGRETVMEAMRTKGRNARDATIYATRINALLKENGKSKEPEQYSEMQPGGPAPLPGVAAAERLKELMHRPVADVFGSEKKKLGEPLSSTTPREARLAALESWRQGPIETIKRGVQTAGREAQNVTSIMDKWSRGEASPEERRQAVTNVVLQQGALIGGGTAFHGTPHTWAGGKPDISKVGTGQGAQSYGHGLYFAENPEVSKTYLSAGQERFIAAHKGGTYKIVEGSARGEVPLPEVYKTMQEAEQALSKMPKGTMYKVDIPDEHIDKMLDWDKPLSEQGEILAKVNARIKEILPDISEKSQQRGFYGNMKGGDFYNYLSDILKPPPSMVSQRTSLASSKLNELGIPGIKYLDQGSRTAGKGTRNFVVFDPEVVRKVEKME